MTRKNILVLISTLTSILIFMFILLRGTLYFPTSVFNQATQNSQTNITPASSTYPIRLIIPSLKINAKILNVGITKSGNMATPNNSVDVGWYKYGTVPGMTGSSVIAGHVDNGFAIDGVFKPLVKLMPGDDVYVVTKDNKYLHYTVVEANTYPYNNMPLERIFNQSDGSYLNLITCQGGWTADHTTYDHRLVVYTKLK